MFILDEKLLRRGGNQLGALAMLAGLVAYFVEPVPGYREQFLFLFGLVVYILSTLKMKSKIGGFPLGGE